MKPPFKVLHVEDLEPLVELYRVFYGRKGFDANVVETIPEALKLMEHNVYDACVVDLSVPSFGYGENNITPVHLLKLAEQRNQNARLFIHSAVVGDPKFSGITLIKKPNTDELLEALAQAREHTGTAVLERVNLQEFTQPLVHINNRTNLQEKIALVHAHQGDPAFLDVFKGGWEPLGPEAAARKLTKHLNEGERLGRLDPHTIHGIQDNWSRQGLHSLTTGKPQKTK
jgi:ActR/RegA family two-component response regulator